MPGTRSVRAAARFVTPAALMMSVSLGLCPITLAGSDPYADTVEAFDLGRGGTPSFDNPLAVLGEPTRFTGEGFFPAVVSPFSPPYLPDEILSIGIGGFITVAFDEPVTNDPGNPFGIDLLIFGNTGFIDDAFPEGLIGGVFSDGGGIVEVSADGRTWHEVPDIGADGLFPTLGYLDAGPYDTVPGAVPSDFTRPVDPSVGFIDIIGLDYAALLKLYNGSGGGTGIDLAWVGLESISYVRVSVPRDAGATIEIDGFADVAPLGLPEDLNGDGVVDGADLGQLLAAWGSGAADLDGNGVVDGADLGQLLAAWTGG